jgi:hypothetical protein
MAEATAAGRGVRLQAVNLPAASAFVNPDSAHHGPGREAGGASIIPPDATASTAIKRPPPRRRACRRDRRWSAWRAGVVACPTPLAPLPIFSAQAWPPCGWPQAVSVASVLDRQLFGASLCRRFFDFPQKRNRQYHEPQCGTSQSGAIPPFFNSFAATRNRSGISMRWSFRRNITPIRSRASNSSRSFRRSSVGNGNR